MAERSTKYIKKKRKICFVLRSYYKYRLGGAELQAYFVARELYKKGWEVHYIFDRNNRLQSDSNCGIILHSLKDFGFEGSFLNYFTLRKKLKEIKPDIVYQRIGFAYTGIVSRFAKKHGIKFVWATSSVEDCRKNRFGFSLKQYHGNLCKKFLLAIVYRIHDYLCDYGMKSANVIIVQTREQKNLLDKNWGLKSMVVKNGHLVPNNLLEKEHPPIVLWLGTLKRLRQAEIFVKLAKKCEDLNCKFVLAGLPSDKKYLHEELFEQMTGLRNMEYVGGVTFKESNEFIGRASVFINTSKYEGFPNTFIQAWMRKTPTVSLNIDPDNVIKKNRLGFHSGSFEQMVNDVRFLIKSKKAREEMGRNARRYAAQEHDINKIILKYVKLFSNLTCI